MTREELEKEYNLHPNGLISSPGKFEGEKLYIPYFFDQEPDEQEFEEVLDVWQAIYHPNAEDNLIFPELKGIKTIILFEDEQGFVHSAEIKGNRNER